MFTKSYMAPQGRRLWVVARTKVILGAAGAQTVGGAAAGEASAQARLGLRPVAAACPCQALLVGLKSHSGVSFVS